MSDHVLHHHEPPNDDLAMRATNIVASHSENAKECREFLDMLGLDTTPPPVVPAD
ncbi:MULTISPECIES: hypothetical protein [Lolliginicoccus]|uniref:Uncharacterized protein n=1 Tax=Lolliginicoccus lacisalsi TaxID=2742202 RepID=A0A927JCA1_9ACTN|nr:MULTISPECIES: hypothetical protein [Lolliginicoccus]MBD8506530.1 hypothetical protein [Lolliginicoccus lacisalsi]